MVDQETEKTITDINSYRTMMTPFETQQIGLVVETNLAYAKTLVLLHGGTLVALISYLGTRTAPEITKNIIVGAMMSVAGLFLIGFGFLVVSVNSSMSWRGHSAMVKTEVDFIASKDASKLDYSIVDRFRNRADACDTLFHTVGGMSLLMFAVSLIVLVPAIVSTVK